MSRRRKLFRTRRARQDLIDIWDHIESDNPAAGDTLFDRIDEACLRLLEHPRLGPARNDIRPGLRYLIVNEYVVLYRIVGEDVEIVRVVHGRRDLFNM